MTTKSIEDLTIDISQEIEIKAAPGDTFRSMIAQLSEMRPNPDADSMHLVLEQWPGGRWFRDLGDNNGHFWGLVQAIKRPTLLEITGPLFMSSPVVSNIQYRLKEVEGGTLIQFRHSAFGFVPGEYKQGLSSGWMPLLDRIRRQAEAKRTTH